VMTFSSTASATTTRVLSSYLRALASVAERLTMSDGITVHVARLTIHTHEQYCDSVVEADFFYLSSD
jgi:hypothetical protein